MHQRRRHPQNMTFDIVGPTVRLDYVLVHFHSIRLISVVRYSTHNMNYFLVVVEVASSSLSEAAAAAAAAAVTGTVKSGHSTAKKGVTGVPLRDGIRLVCPNTDGQVRLL
jgi:hypothetical protein